MLPWRLCKSHGYSRTMPCQLKDEPLAAWQPTADIITEQDLAAIDLEPNALELSLDVGADENEAEPDVTPDAHSTAAEAEPSASQGSADAADDESPSSSDTPDAEPGSELMAEVDSLLGNLAAAVFRDPGALGAVARSLRDAAPRTTRQRDLFPLPLSTCGSEFAKAIVAVLNFLYRVRAPVLVPRRVSAAQRAALDNIESALQEFTERLLSCSSGPFGPGAWDVFEPNAVEQRLELDAACVDCPERAGTCDPMPLLPEDVRAQLLDADGLFSAAPAGLDRFPGFYAGQRDEYLKLVVRQLRCGKIGLAGSVRGGGTVFPVGKSSGNQREVWHGSRVSAAAARPPRPPHLASPTAFRAIDLGEGELLRFSKRDGRCFFDQLLLPEGLRDFMGRPTVSVAELRGAGLSAAELSAALPCSGASS